MKKVEQVAKDGSVVIDYDDPVVREKVDALFERLFPGEVSRDEKQIVISGNVGILTAAVTYLGHPWSIEKKRIQLKDYFKDYYLRNIKSGKETLFVGIYHYADNYVYVVFRPIDYYQKKSHNSSAHVQTFDLQYATRAGRYDKVDKNGNVITILSEERFVEYIKEESWIEAHSSYEAMMRELFAYFASFLDKMPKLWKGVDCYKEMLAANDNNARQGAWEGFYLEFLFKNYLKSMPTKLIEWWNKKEDDAVDFDVKIPWADWSFGDFKAESAGSDILGNSLESLDDVIEKNKGRVLYLCCICSNEKDSDHNYVVTRFWNQYRDKPYQSEDDIRNRYGKKMKYSVTPKEFRILNIDSTAYQILKEKPFAQGRNSNGKERKPKLKVSKGMIDALTIYAKKL